MNPGGMYIFVYIGGYRWIRSTRIESPFSHVKNEATNTDFVFLCRELPLVKRLKGNSIWVRYFSVFLFGLELLQRTCSWSTCLYRFFRRWGHGFNFSTEDRWGISIIWLSVGFSHFSSSPTFVFGLKKELIFDTPSTSFLLIFFLYYFELWDISRQHTLLSFF